MWSWAICTDTCAICRNNLYEPSIEYQANPNGKLSGSMCQLVRLGIRSSVSGVRIVHHAKAMASKMHADLSRVLAYLMPGQWLQVILIILGSASPGAAAATCSTLIAFSGG